MPVRLTPQQFATKWGNRLKGSLDDIRQGIDRVDQAPGIAAAAKADKWQQRVSSAESKRKWSRRVGAVSLEDWKTAIRDKGLPRIAAGVDAAQDKQVRFATELFAHQNEGLRVIEGMPDLVLEDSINRMTAWTRHMAAFEISD